MEKTAQIKSRWDDHYMLPAFLGCVHWALGKDELVEAFRADTGNNWKPAAGGIDKMIDAATGADLRFMQQFVTWVEDNVFGTPESLGVAA